MASEMISVITPSYNMFDYLRRCVASVEDQSNTNHEHIIVDGSSSDATVDWLKQKNNINFVSEKDKGMYDAINKGMKISKGNIVAYLNCDEQYLTGTLEFIQKYFDNHPDVDVIFGDSLIINPDGTLICYLKGYKPRLHYIMSSHLYVLSCTMFFRRNIIDDGVFFSDTLKAIGDADFIVRVIRQGYKVVHVKKYLSAFTYTGSNMSIGENAARESLKFKMSAPLWVRILKAPLNILRLCEKLLSGGYYQRVPFSYEVYPEETILKRKSFVVNNASWRWPK